MEKSNSPFLFEADTPAEFGQTLRMLRGVQPVFYDELRASWVVLRHRDVFFALRNPELFSNTIYKKGSLGHTFAAMDGADHFHHRRLFSRAFTPRAVQHYGDRIIVPAVQRLVDQVASQPGCELISEFCSPLPIDVISPMLGMTPEYVGPCRALVNDIIAWNLYREDPAVAATGQRAYDQLLGHVRPVVEREIRAPGDHLLGEIIRIYQAEGQLRPEQMVHFAAGLVVGGFETTSWMLACALGALLLHPPALERVRRDPALLMPAVEESMRWTPSMPGVLRSTTREVTLSGVKLPAEAPIMLCIAAAHYDEEVYPHPEVFDIDRKLEHLLFIAGPHYCLGAALARLEARIGLAVLFERLEGLRLDPAHRLRFAMGARGSAMLGPTALHVLHDADLARAA